MAGGILVDALLIRMAIVPSIMMMFGKANWWFPKWLDRILPRLSVDADDEAMLAIRREMDRSLAPYRRKMSAEQLGQLERQYLQKRLFEHFEVPRLSLFYLT